MLLALPVLAEASAGDLVPTNPPLVLEVATVAAVCLPRRSAAKAGDAVSRFVEFADDRITDHRSHSYLAIFDCASINLSYKARNPSESVRVPARIGMKLVSPLQRGTTWICK